MIQRLSGTSRRRNRETVHYTEYPPWARLAKSCTTNDSTSKLPFSKDTLTSGMFSYISSCRKRSINTHQKRVVAGSELEKITSAGIGVTGSFCEACEFQSPTNSFRLLSYIVVRCIQAVFTVTNSLPRAQWFCPPMFFPLPIEGNVVSGARSGFKDHRTQI